MASPIHDIILNVTDENNMKLVLIRSLIGLYGTRVQGLENSIWHLCNHFTIANQGTPRDGYILPPLTLFYYGNRIPYNTQTKNYFRSLNTNKNESNHTKLHGPLLLRASYQTTFSILGLIALLNPF